MIPTRQALGAAASLAVLAAGARAQCEVDKFVGSTIQFKDQFAYSVDVDGATVVAGCLKCDDAGGESGAVFVFAYDGFGVTETQVLTASDGAAFDHFGWDAAIDGDVIVAGAPDESAAGAGSGAAYVFRRTGGAWSEEAKLVPSEAAAGWRVGKVVAVQGDVLVLGVPDADPAAIGTNAGAALVYRFDGAGWVEEASLAPVDLAAGDGLGSAVAIDGDRIAVGAWRADPGGESNAGAVHTFRHDGAAWVEEATLHASDGFTGDELGSAVALRGDRLFVGAPRDDDGGFGPSSDRGSVYYFENAEGAWSERQKLLAAPTDSGSLFGTTVDFDGDRVVVGHFLEMTFGQDAGAAYSWRQVGGTWQPVEKFHPGDIVPFDEFAGDVAVSGDLCVVSSDFNDEAGSNSGAAYVFDLDDGPCAPLYGWPKEISVSAGGTQDMFLSTPSPALFGDLVWVLGSASGTEPGFDLPGLHVPLNPDGYFDFTLLFANVPPLVGTLTTFDDAGHAQAAFTLGPGGDPSLVGLRLWHSGIAINDLGLAGESYLASPPIELDLVP